MRELLRVWAGIVGNDLAGTEEFPFVDDQAFEAYGASGVDFVCADSDLCAEVVAEAIAETRAAIDKHISRIDQGHEPLGFCLVGADDSVGVFRAVAVNVLDGGVQAIYDFYREDVIEILG